MSVKVTINGKQLDVPVGTTILDAAALAGTEVPTLCRDRAHDRPFTSCFVCLAQIEGMGRLVPACGTAVRDGMVIDVDGAKVRAARRTGLELLMSDHNADCKAPCHKKCPAHADVQGYVGAIANEDYAASMEILRKKIPLPGSLGRVCPHPCEEDCRRARVEAPVSIRNLKRWVADWEMEHGVVLPQLEPFSGKTVAIVGGGPAGLTAAYYLRVKGHGSVIFDQMPQLGGMLRYGIPEYRLPKAVLDWEIAQIVGLGHIEVKCDQALGRDFTVKQLEDRYDAVVLAIGAWQAKGLRVAGEDHPRVFGGIDYLREVALGRRVDLGRNVVVVGGGNTAIDAARTARRQGCRVTLVYRRSRAEMPAEACEIDDAGAEGVKYEFLVAPTGLRFAGDRLVGMECQRMELGEPDASGRRSPVPIEGSEFLVPADAVIKAIGQDIEPGVVPPGDVEQTRWSTVNVHRPTFRTNREKVFAAGDLVTGPQLVVDAVYMGRKAAEGIDLFLRGEPYVERLDVVSTRRDVPDSLFAQYEKRPRLEPVVLEPAARITSDAEVDTGFSTAEAVQEASRCLSCGCQDVVECKLKKYIDEYQVNPRRYAGASHDYAVDASHPDIRRDPNKCVKCGKCVEVCDQGRGLAVFGFASRGFESTVGPTLNQPLVETACEACGDCVAACPVGALTEQVPLDKPGPYPTVAAATVCTSCSLACDVGVHALADKVIRVTPREDGWNDVHMCRKGRFEWTDANAAAPVVDLVAAVRELAGKLAGGRIVLGPDCTNEEAVLARAVAAKLGGEVRWLAPDAVAHGWQNLVVAEAAGQATVAGLTSAPAILVVGADVGEAFPVAGVLLRKAAHRGAQIALVDCGSHRLGTSRELERKALDRMGALLAQPGAVLVVGPQVGDLAEPLAALVKKHAVKVLALRQGANAVGLEALGIEPLADGELAGGGAATLLLGDAPADLARPRGFFAAQSVTAAAKVQADLVLPRTHALDDAGTVVATDGRVCELRPGRSGRRANWELVRDLAVAVGAEVDVEAALAEARALQV
ncbi:MAG TPA: FAD-dependent oxidoreductase [Candidatus Krumholzibacteria bacterium]|nr:FAD-dependent oxidoreductase [Candidatus Krumholzibacteria bacterium]HPD70189.1 FAD-dependent oxidoreductase [Candidatus Krumholzibacteria bacterium]HRY40111.1 FAD-dependent oxidoreductase [Candidatus Krumholzibacteria bacterium]